MSVNLVPGLSSSLMQSVQVLADKREQSGAGALISWEFQQGTDWALVPDMLICNTGI